MQRCVIRMKLSKTRESEKMETSHASENRESS
jgi:hypothetical protein